MREDPTAVPGFRPNSAAASWVRPSPSGLPGADVLLPTGQRGPIYEQKCMLMVKEICLLQNWNCDVRKVTVMFLATVSYVLTNFWRFS